MKEGKNKRRMRIIALLLAVLLIGQMPMQYIVKAEETDTEVLLEESGAGGEVAVTNTESQPQGMPQESNMQQSPEGEPSVGESDDSASQEPIPQGAIDWTEKTGQLSLSVEGASYRKQEQGESEIFVRTQNQMLDLSDARVEDIKYLNLELGFTGSNFIETELPKKGDIFTYVISSEYFELTDTQYPLDIVTCEKEAYLADRSVGLGGGERLATYEVKDNIVTVTFVETLMNEQVASLFGVLQIEAKVKDNILKSEGPTEVVWELQTGNQTTVMLPALPIVEENEKLKDPVVQEDVDLGTDVTDVTGNASTGESVGVNKPDKQETNDQVTEEVPDKDKGLLGKVKGMFGKITAFFGSEPKTGDYTTGNVYKTTIKKEDLPIGFEQVKVTIQNKAGGYTNVDIGDARNVGFGFGLILDDDYLYNTLEALMGNADFPQYTGDDAEYQGKVVTYIENHYKDRESPIQFKFDLGEDFRDVSAEEVIFREEGVAEGDPACGTYQINKGTLTVTMSPAMIAYSDVVASFGFTCQLDNDATTGSDPIEEALEDGKVIHQSVGGTGGGGTTPEAPKYSVEKDAKSKVSTTEIEYGITLEAKESNYLNGKTLVDMMPAGLELKTIMMTSKNGEEITDPAVMSPSDYVISGQELRYTFESLSTPEEGGAPTNRITSATFKVVLKLNADSYQAFINSGSVSKVFTNKAKLQDGEGSDPLAVSEEIETLMKADFIKKDGKQEDLKGTRYSWTIDVNTYIPGFKNSYLVDTLSWTDHTYDFDRGITVYYGAETKKITAVDKVEGTEPWNQLTIEELETMSAGRTDPFYYIYEDKDEAAPNANKNPFYGKEGVSPGETEYKQRAVLILPFTEFTGVEKPEQVKIKYFTDLNLHGLSIDKYLKLTDDKANGGIIGDREIGNIANLLWNYKEGNGPNPATWEEAEVNFGKTVDSNIDILEKKGVSYNEKTHMLNWKLEVNKLGANLTDITIVDTLANGAYKVDAGLDITYYRYDLENMSQPPQTGKLKKGSGEKPYYELKANSGNPVDTDIVITLDDLTNQYYYVLSFALELTDPTILGKQDKEQVTSNKATITAKIEGEEKTRGVEAQIKTPTTLVEKEAVGDYGYQNHTLDWKITVNPNGIFINDASIMDTLPIGNEFAEITDIKKDGTSLAATELTTIKDGMVSGSIGTLKTVTFQLGDIGTDTYEIYLSSKITDAYRNEQFKGNATVDFTNAVQLEGMVIATTEEGAVSHVITGATAADKHSVSNKPVGKIGKYDKEAGRIDWTLYINQDQMNVAGMYLEEKLSVDPEGKPITPIHELDLSSIKVFTVEMNSDGTPKDTSSAEVTVTQAIIPDVNLSAKGFRFCIPSNGAANYNTYKLTFSTYLLKEAEQAGAKIMNKVFMKDNGDRVVEESGTSDGGFNGGFDFNEVASKSIRPKLLIKKISSNSANINGANADDYLGLSSAEFSMSAYAYTREGDKPVNLTAEMKKYDKMRITANGSSTFLNIMEGTHIYKLEETKAPEGYTLDSTPKFFMWAKDADKLTPGTKVNVKGIEYDLTILSNEGMTSAAAEIVLTNNPSDTAGFIFTKQEPDVYNLTNNTENTYKNLQGAIFRVVATGDNIKGKVKDQYATSDTDGKVTFPMLDPGTYQLIEVEAPGNLTVGGKLGLEVDVVGSTYKYTITKGSDANGMELSGSPDNQVVTDDYIKGNLEFKKYVKYETLSDVSGNEEPLHEAEFTLKSTKINDVANTTYSTTGFSNKEGIVSFSNLPVGEYTLSEKLKNGYVANTKTYTVEVKEAEDTDKVLGEKKLNNGSSVTYYGKKAVVTMKENLATGDAITRIDNTPIQGTIRFKKVIDANDVTQAGGTPIIQDGTPLLGAKFGLFRMIGTSIAPTATYTAISSGVDGEVTFAGVEYGDYVLRELETPKGYEAVADVTILRTALTLTIDATPTFDYTYSLSEGVVKNKLIRTDINLIKTDVDTNKLSEIEFKIYRKNTGKISADGSGLVVSEVDATNTYFGYSPQPSATSNDIGAFSFSKLPYGEYLLIEQPSDSVDLQDGYQTVALHVAMSGDTNASVTTTVKINQAFQGELKQEDTDEEHFEVSGNDIADEAWKDLPKADDGKYTVVNQLKYGYVQLSKQAVNTDTTEAKEALGNARYKIYKGNAVSESALYLTLDTSDTSNNAATKGMFTPDAEGFYTDNVDGSKKHLLYGTYTIKEEHVLNGYYTVSDALTFMIGDITVEEGAGHEGTAWISNPSGENDKTKVTYIPQNGTKSDHDTAHFANQKFEAYMDLHKIDSWDGAGLEGVEFKLSRKGDANAWEQVGDALKTDAEGNISYTITKTGHYQLTELNKEGYEVTTNDRSNEEPSDRFTAEFTVGNDDFKKTLIVKANDFSLREFDFLNQTDSNRGLLTEDGILNHRKTTKLTVEKIDSSTKHPLEAEFEIYKNVDGETDPLIMTGMTGKVYCYDKDTDSFVDTENSAEIKSGTLIVNNLGWGNYYLKESKAPEGYVLPEGSKEFSFNSDVLAVGFTTASSTAIENTKNEFTLNKTDAIGNPLSGAGFTIEKKDDLNSWSKVLDTAPNSDSWKWSGSLVADTTYRVKETTVPVGYEELKTPIEFMMKADGTIEWASDKPDYAGYIVQDEKNLGIQVKNTPIEINLLKTDLAGEELTGAIFTISGRFVGDTNPSEVTGITTDIIKNRLSGKLIAGEEYTLQETSAPKGYTLAKDIKFWVSKEGEIQITWNPDDRVSIPETNKDTLKLQDEPIKVRFMKKDENASTMKGAEFLLEGEFADQTKIAEYDEEKGGVYFTSTRDAFELSGQLIAGQSYVLTEEKAPSGYRRLQTSVTFSVDSAGKLELTTPVDGAVKLNDDKISISVKNTKTRFYLNKITDEKDPVTGELLPTKLPGATLAIVEDKNGVAQQVEIRSWTSGEGDGNITELPVGTYWLKEKPNATPNGYLTADPIKFTLNDNNTITLADEKNGIVSTTPVDGVTYSVLNMVDQRIVGSVSLTKVDKGDNTKTLEGVTFKLFKEGNTVADTPLLIAEGLTTKANGVWRSDKETILNQETELKLEQGLLAGSYYFKETATRDDYYLNNEEKLGAFTVKADKHDEQPQMKELIVPNERFKTFVSLTKVDQVSGDILAGTEFTLYQKEDLDTYKSLGSKSTGVNGELEFEINKKGSYRLVETRAVPGYELHNERAFTASFTVDNTDAFQNKELIIKAGANDNLNVEDVTKYQLSVENASFYNGNQESAKGHVANARKLGTLTLTKADGVSNKALSDVKFTLYQKKSGGSVFDEIADFLTGKQYASVETLKWTDTDLEDGQLKIQDLPWGEYYIKETGALSGYELPDTEYPFKIGRFTDEVVLEVSANASEPIKNIKTKIHFTKYGKLMESCDEVNKDYSEPLAGAEFTIYTDKECIQMVEVKDAVRANTATSSDVEGSKGYVEFIGLPAGYTYYIKETSSPSGYQPNENIYAATLDDKGYYSRLSIVSGPDMTDAQVKQDVEDGKVVNDLYRTKISLKKVSEQDHSLSVAGSTYGLFKKTTDIPNGAVKPNSRARMKAVVSVAETVSDPMEGWTQVATAITSEDGMLTFEGVLANTAYRVKELKAPDGSHLSASPVEIEFQTVKNDETGEIEVKIQSFKDGNGTANVDPETGEITWLEPSIMLGFVKKDMQDKLLAGAEFELLDMDGKVLDAWTSEEKEYIIHADKMKGAIVAGGTYQLVEKSAPGGYKLAVPVVFTVEGREAEAGAAYVQAVVMKDEIISLKIDKRAGDTGTSLAGAKLQVHAPGNAMTAKTSGGDVLEWTTDGKEKSVEGLAAGKYVLTETEAPSGYEKATDIRFEIDAHGKVLVDGKEVANNLITMTDEKSKVDISNADPYTNGNAKTGDATPVLLYVLGAVAAFGTMIELIRRKKKQKKN